MTAISSPACTPRFEMLYNFDTENFLSRVRRWPAP
jgi:hypothetical protein